MTKKQVTQKSFSRLLYVLPQGGPREWIPKAQSLQKYDARTHDGTPEPFRVTCPICLWFTRVQKKYGSRSEIGDPREWMPKAQSLQKYHARTHDGTPDS